jgi:glutamate-ammonia-ligase adenylyltransferase
MTDSAQSVLSLASRQVPAPFQARVGNYLESLTPHLGDDLDVRALEKLPRVLAASDFVGRALVAQPALFAELVQSGDLSRAYGTHELSERLGRLLADVPDDTELKRRLRLFRRRESVRVAFRDLAGWADLREVMVTMSALADACLSRALDALSVWAKTKYGTPSDEAGNESVFVVLGMGKLGGEELNFSSDVDLIFAYSADGETRGGPRTLSNHEYFTHLGQALINALSQPTAEGYVFRVDMRLRPDGQSGPLALSFDATEQYYQTHGRDWERYALIKARVVAGNAAAGVELLAALQPFVFRKYLDYGAFEAIRSMKVMIEREIARKGMREHVKLGFGGIREIEFIGQAMQLIRGGREPPLQTRPILEVLERLADRDYLPVSARDELAGAYIFLRNVEHRLQMVADEQTHVLPRGDEERFRIAYTMDFPDWERFEAELNAHRERVHHHFVQTFVLPEPAPGADSTGGLAAVWSGATDAEGAQRVLENAGFSDTAAVIALLTGYRQSSSTRTLSADGRVRLDRLMPRLIAEAGKTRDAQTTLVRLVALLETIGRRTTYFVMLAENPSALTQLVKLCAASPWIANWIAKHPIVFDELLDPRTLYEPPTREHLAAELRSRIAALPESDQELQLEVLREFHHAHVLRVAATDIGPGLLAEQVGALLAVIAEVVLSECLGIAWRAMTERHGQPRNAKGEVPGFAVVGYGKLGSLELGYASDLDMIYLYEGADDGMTDGARSIPNEEFFARLGQRLIHLLTTRTPSGLLYEVDMRLRPSGKSGTLVTSLTTFREYQQTQAWTWEHQALVRARAIAGAPSVAAAFAEVRHAILCQPRDEARLLRDVVEMRHRMAAGHPAPKEGFDLKHSRGGIVDIEFMVQYCTLRWAHRHPVLTRYTDNIHLLETLQAEGLLEAQRAAFLIDAYRRYLSMEHRLKLAERGSVVTDAETLGNLPQDVKRIWNEMFNETI